MQSKDMREIIEAMDEDGLNEMVVEAFHRILVHYAFWMMETLHQFGGEKTMELESRVWEADFANQIKRLSKTLGFSLNPKGIPTAISEMTREGRIDLLEKLGVNWLANDGIWFQAVENEKGMIDAKRVNDTCWMRFSPFEAGRIKRHLGLSEQPGLEGLKKALAFRMYALINRQSVEDIDENSFIFRMNECRVQSARKRKGLPDYPCKSAGLVEYPYFASSVDKRIITECVGCPPDAHPEDWYCAWKFTLKNHQGTDSGL